MPSLAHEILVELFRNRPQLATELLEACSGIQLPGGQAELASIDLSQAVPSEYRADAITVVRDGDVARSAVIVEVQLRIDTDKERTWPLYVATLRARLGCPVMLLVVTPGDAVAVWARRRIELGHPGFALEPIVVAFADIPRITDRAAAAEAPELAVLSAVAHREAPIGVAALAAIEGLPEELARLYWDIVVAGLGIDPRDLPEADMIKDYVFRSEFARKYIAIGRDEGREKGRVEGRMEGRNETLRSTAVRIARVKVSMFSAEVENRIRALDDARALEELIDMLAGATTAAEADAALARLA